MAASFVILFFSGALHDCSSVAGMVAIFDVRVLLSEDILRRLVREEKVVFFRGGRHKNWQFDLAKGTRTNSSVLEGAT